VVERLFTSHFEQGKNIGQLEVLLDIAKEAGLDEKQVKVRSSSVISPCLGLTDCKQSYLESEEDLEWVITIDLFWKEQQTEGLPFFVFNDK